MARWIIKSIPHGGPIELFLVPALFHDWCNNGRGMCYSLCGMVHVKDLLPLIERSSLCSGSNGYLIIKKILLIWVGGLFFI